MTDHAGIPQGKHVPCFSVVIPLFNKARCIERAIGSVLQQDSPDLELIVVNDGSTDGGERLVERFTDPRVKLINQRNAGGSAARNTGIRHSSAPYVALLDADDSWDADFLVVIRGLIDEFPEVGAYATHIRNSVQQPDAANTRVYDPKRKEDSWLVDCMYSDFERGYYPVSSSTICVKKEVFSSVGLFNETLAIGEDLDMWIRIHRHSGIALSNRFAATYYTDAQNRSVHRADFSWRELEFFRHVRSSYLNDRLAAQSFAALEQWSSRRIYNIIVRLISLGERSAASRVFLDNWRALRPEHRVMAVLRLGAPRTLIQFLKQYRRAQP